MESALAAIEAEGGVLRGRFTSSANAIANRDVEWCDRRLLARIHRRTLEGLRRLIEPVPAAALIRFLFAWQHARPGAQLHGRDGLLRVIERLQGFEAAAGCLGARPPPGADGPLRSRLAGRALPLRRGAWGRLGLARERAPRGPRLSPTVPVALLLRRDLGWLLEPRDGALPGEPSGPARDVLAHLQRSGASFVEEIATPASAACASRWRRRSASW